MKMKALLLVLAVIFVLACGVSSEQLTATAEAARAQTQTAAPTRTATPTRTPTKTPKPTSTATLTPTNTPEPTPAAIGETVQYDDLEITLLEVATHSHIVTGGYYYYYSKPGEIYVDVAVLVKNSGTSPVDMTMQEIYIVEETGDSWYANFFGVQTVDLEKHLNPFASIKLEQLYVGGLPVSFEKNTYLRLVWYIKQNQNLIFGIQDSPQFAIPVE